MARVWVSEGGSEGEWVDDFQPVAIAARPAAVTPLPVQLAEVLGESDRLSEETYAPKAQAIGFTAALIAQSVETLRLEALPPKLEEVIEPYKEVIEPYYPPGIEPIVVALGAPKTREYRGRMVTEAEYLKFTDEEVEVKPKGAKPMVMAALGLAAGFGKIATQAGLKIPGLSSGSGLLGAVGGMVGLAPRPSGMAPGGGGVPGRKVTRAQVRAKFGRSITKAEFFNEYGYYPAARRKKKRRVYRRSSGVSQSDLIKALIASK